MMIDQSMGLMFRTFEVMYSILSPAFMGSAVSAHGWSCNSPLLTTMCFVCLSVSNPNSGPPQTQWQAQDRYTKCSWASNGTGKNGQGFFVGVKLKKLAYGCKRASATCYKPPKVHNERLRYTKTMPLKPVLPTARPHDHMTTKKDQNVVVESWVNPRKSLHSHLFSQCWAIPFRLWGLRIGSLDLASLKWHLHFC